MTAANVTRIGQTNQSGATDALFLKVFAGEVLTAFEETNVMLDKHNTRTISSGKSAQFPASGKIGAEYHTPGTEITGLNMNHAEVVITIDDLLLSHAFIANIDEAKNHYDVRSEYSTQMGRKLAVQMDKHLFQVGLTGARSANVVTGLPGGTVINDVTSTAADLIDAAFAAAQALDENDVDENDRYFVLRPAEYYKLVQDTKAINRDWGGSGVYAEGTVLKVAGMHIVKSNHVPNAVVSNDTVDAGTGNKYAGDFSSVLGFAFQKSAIGTVKLLDMAMESQYDIRRQGTLFVAKYAVGHGVLRPEACVEITSASA